MLACVPCAVSVKGSIPNQGAGKKRGLSYTNLSGGFHWPTSLEKLKLLQPQKGGGGTTRPSSLTHFFYLEKTSTQRHVNLFPFRETGQNPQIFIVYLDLSIGEGPDLNGEVPLSTIGTLLTVNVWWSSFHFI